MRISNKFQSTFLATSKGRYFKVGLSAALLIAILAFKLPIYETISPKHIDELEPEHGNYIELQAFVIKEEVKELPKELPKTEKVFIEQAIIDPVEKEIKSKKKVETIENALAIEATTNVLPEEKPKEKEIKTMTFVSEMPTFKGGEIALQQYLAGTDYCDFAVSNGIEGTVHVGFIIDENGKITNVKILKGVTKCLDEAALERVKNMPDWNAGKQAYEPVRVRMHVPINFTLH